MRHLKRMALVLAGFAAAVGAVAQTTPPDPSNQSQRPAATKPAAAVPVAQSLVGKSVFSSDGSRVGDVHAVKTAPDGRVTGLLVKTGGFLGFGGRLVEVPEGKFTASAQDVRLGLTAEEAGKLPEVKDGT
jgi:sporulation protein YlmC with PRC-barrel domain